MPTRKLALISTLAGATCFACGADDGKTSEPTQAPGTVPASGCGLDTGFAGDDVCIAAPDPTEGFQLHFGPDTYAGADLDRFVLGPGEEVNECLIVETPNEEDVLFNRTSIRIRPGTHHLIVFENPTLTAEPGTLTDCELGPAFRFVIGSQGALDEEGGSVEIPDSSRPPAPENAGHAQKFGAKTRVALNLHYVNTTDEPILKEAWINFHYADPAEVTTIMDPITFIGGLGMNVPPRSDQVVDASCSLPANGPDELRIMGLSAHMHAHGARFSAYKVSPDANAPDGESRELVYETYDWAEPDFMQYDSVTNNPVPNAGAETGGGASGLLTLERGERIDYECEIKNDLDTPLRFANEAYTAEMCNLFGMYAPSTGGPWRCFNM